MNNIFSFNRFRLLVKRQWLDFGKIYLISLVVLASVICGFYLFCIPKVSQGLPPVNPDGYLDLKFRYPLFVIVGFLFITIISSSYFSSFGQKSRAIIELMVPASIFEKFLTGIFYTAILSIFSYVLIFGIIDFAFGKYIVMSFADHKFELSSASTKVSDQYYNFTLTRVASTINYKEFWPLTFMPFFATSLFLLGSIYFNRFHYIKTAISVLVFFWAGGYILYQVMSKINAQFKYQGPIIGQKGIFIIVFSTSILVTFWIWFIAYVRLKEKEV